MKDEDLKKLVYKLGEEAMPVVVSPGIISPEAFIKEVLEERLPNPYIPDTPQRIATDTSQKVAIRFGETIKGYLAKNECDNMQIIPFVIAAWFRYLIGLDDKGNEMQLSSDPMMDILKSAMEGIELGKEDNDMSGINWIMNGEDLFGVKLSDAGDMEKKVRDYLGQMLKGAGAVRETLHNLISQ